MISASTVKPNEEQYVSQPNSLNVKNKRRGLQMKQAEKLLTDIEKAMSRWNERSCFKLKGISNLSRADLDCLEMYAKRYIANDGRGFEPFMSPRGGVQDVLEAYGITADSQW